MTTVTTVPVGSTGILLEGLDVNGAVRESVVPADPETADAFQRIVSTQPASDTYGPAVWVQGTPNVSVGALPGINIVSSIPFYVAQSSSPWDIRGGVQVSSIGTVSTQIISSIPFFVAQSSDPWAMNGGVAVTNSPNVNVTNVPAVNITSSIPFFVAQSSAPWDVRGGINVSSHAAVASTWPLNTTMVNVVSSIPFFVSQSTASWQCVETVSTSGGTNATTRCFLANLNTTVIKASAGQVYGIMGANNGSSNVYVRFYEASAAANVIASTGAPRIIYGLLASSTPNVMFDVGVSFSSGITILTQQQPFTATTSIAPTASTAVITIFYA